MKQVCPHCDRKGYHMMGCTVDVNREWLLKHRQDKMAQKEISLYKELLTYPTKNIAWWDDEEYLSRNDHQEI